MRADRGDPAETPERTSCLPGMRIPQDEEAALGLLGRRGPRAVALRLGRMQPGRGRMPLRRRMPRRSVRPGLAPFPTARALPRSIPHAHAEGAMRRGPQGGNLERQDANSKFEPAVPSWTRIPRRSSIRMPMPPAVRPTEPIKGGRDRGLAVRPPGSSFTRLAPRFQYLDRRPAAYQGKGGVNTTRYRNRAKTERTSSPIAGGALSRLPC